MMRVPIIMLVVMADERVSIMIVTIWGVISLIFTAVMISVLVSVDVGLILSGVSGTSTCEDWGLLRGGGEETMAFRVYEVVAEGVVHSGVVVMVAAAGV